MGVAGGSGIGVEPMIDSNLDAIRGQEGGLDHRREAGEGAGHSSVGYGTKGATHGDADSTWVFDHVGRVGSFIRSKEADVESAGIGGAGLGGQGYNRKRLQLGVAEWLDELADALVGGEIKIGEEVVSFPFGDFDLKRKNETGTKIARNVKKRGTRGQSGTRNSVKRVHAEIRMGARIDASERRRGAGGGG